MPSASACIAPSPIRIGPRDLERATKWAHPTPRKTRRPAGVSAWMLVLFGRLRGARRAQRDLADDLAAEAAPVVRVPEESNLARLVPRIPNEPDVPVHSRAV